MALLDWAKKADFDMMFKRYNVIIEGPAIKPEDDPDVKKVLPKEEPFRTLAMAVIFGDTEKAVQAAKTALERTSPLDVIEKGLAKGMDAVSALYAKGAYFLPDIMLSADAMTAAMAVAEQKLGRAREKKGTVVSFVAEGDPHDIGKNLVVMFLKANGFEAVDLGRDVPDKEVIEAVKKYKPVMLTGTALMTTTMTAFPRVAKALQEQGISVPVFGCGGGAVKRDFVESYDMGVYGVKAFHAPKLAEAALAGKSWKEIRKEYPKIVGEFVAEYADRM
ncbi:MAG: B12-binding domain-containing protein [Candidatus Methanosuratincola verstraetei]|jgi:methanol corrinoid protein|uniref:Methanol methyltransferase corrinoid protein n=1 Tax=Methanosuratincola subterraneus TaxID=2593994 RepID=A0A444L953_METS7|nr:MAG: Methanol methyltransferase corrinoid protein [Candidatus Methanosuratincola subterraneus]